MPSVDVKDASGKKVGTVDLPEAWFSGEVNVPVMHQVVTAQLANARQDSARTKARGEVRGGGRKPWRQKGTGRARQGSIRSPQWVGGGVAHGRKADENHHVRVNKKVRRLALRSALTDRANGDNVVVVRGLGFDAPRTKDAVAALGALELADRKVLVVLSDNHQPTVRSFRNLRTVHTLVVDQLNVYDVLKSDVVVFAEEALDLIGTGQRSAASDTGQRSAASTGERPADTQTDRQDTLAEDEEVTA